MEYSNGQHVTRLSDTVDYSRVLHNGVSRDVLESLLGEHDRARQQEITVLRRQVGELSASLEATRNGSGTTDGAADVRSELAQLRREFATGMASFQSLVKEGDGNLHEMQLASLRRQVSQLEGVLESNYQRELRVAEERENALRSEMAQMRQDLQVSLETLHRMPAGEESTTGIDELKHLERQVTELGASLLEVSHEQQRAAQERESALKADLAHMRRDLLVTLEASYRHPADRFGGDASIAGQNPGHEEPTLRPESIGEMINTRFDELQSRWSGSQIEQYRQLISQIAEVQLELDNLSTGMQAILPSDPAGPVSDPTLGAQVQALVEAMQHRASESESSGSVDELNRLHAEIAGLRGDLQATLHPVSQDGPGASAASPSFTPDDLVRIIATQLNAAKSEADRSAANRDSVLRRELSEIRQEVQSAVQHVRASAGDTANGATVDLSELQVELSEIRAALARPTESHEAELRAELTQLRQDLHSAGESGSPPIGDDVAALVASLQEAAGNQERVVQTQQQALQAAMTQMREEMRAALKGLTRESIDTFEKRQSQLRLDQLEMERNLAQLRQELVATQADPVNKKKLWR